MITTDYVKSLANTASYSKGKSIQNSSWKIEFFKVEHEGAYDYISASVLGSYDNEYGIDMKYNTETDTLEDTYCECPAFEEYSGICKHCVAVLLEYKKYCERQVTMEAFVNRQKGTSEYDMRSRYFDVGSVSIKHKPIRRTTPQMKELLERQVRLRLASYQQKDMIGQVKLEPNFSFDEQEVSLDFKIGDTQMYVLKDVFEFSERMENSTDYSYGKKLKFVHTIDMFTEESQKIVSYLNNWTRRNEQYYGRTQYYYGYGMRYSKPKLRTISMDCYELEEFLQTVGVQRIMSGSMVLPVKYERPKQEVLITGHEDGIEIRLPQMLRYVGNTYHIYVCKDGIYCVPLGEEGMIQTLYGCAEDNGGRPIYIQSEDIPEFCREFLPMLEEKFQCSKKNFDASKFVIDPAKFQIYLDMPQDDYISCRVQVIYGKESYNLMDKNMQRNARDFIGEMEVEQCVAPWFNAFNPLTKEWVLAEDEEMLYELLTTGIPRFHEIGEVFISEALKKLKVRSTMKVSAGVSLSGNLLELKMSVDDISNDELLNILCRYQKRKKFYRMKNGTFLNIEDERIHALYELKQGMGIKDSEFKKEEILLPKYRALFLDTKIQENQSFSIVKNKEFKSLVRNMKTIEDNDFELPQQMKEILREYQKRGFLWIKTLKNNGFGGILADDMGLGKTLQVITFLLSEYEGLPNNICGRTLIVAPASLVFNWKNEMEHFAPQLSVKMIVGTAEERARMIQSVGEREILLTSYDLLKRDISSYKGISFANQIIDEAQYIKNHNTQAAKAVRRIESDFRLALTGTPVENRLSELWSIFDYLMPGFLYPYQTFRKELEIPIVQNNEEEAAQRLQKMVKPFILRRLKRDVLKDLPDKIEKNMYAKMEEEQQRLYDAHVKRLKLMLDKQSDEEFRNSKLYILSELTKLRQLCCYPGLIYENYLHISAKEYLCMELIENAIEGGHKILLFSQFTTMLERLLKLFEQRNISFYLLTGATSKEKRNQMVQDFEKNDISVFCISLKAGGTGLNLTAADIVIHYDPWWNLAVQNQATDRVYRIGQKNVVSVYKLIAEGSIEENIVKLQERKRELADQILNGEDMGSGTFDREELIELLGS